MSTLVLDFREISPAEPASDAVAMVSYDRVVRGTSGGIYPPPLKTPVRLSETNRVPVLACDDPDLTEDSAGFVIFVDVRWAEAGSWQDVGRRFKVQVHTADGDEVALSKIYTPDLTALPPPYVDVAALIEDIKEHGLKGDPGDPGGPGPANQLSIGTVGDGADAAATITGDAPAQQLNLILPKGEPGEPGAPGEPGSPTEYELRGTGSPVGKITPPSAGTYYTDTAATNGAVRWASTGTTNTSWIVDIGDTGNRSVASWLPVSPTVGSDLVFTVRRAGQTVTLGMENTWASSGGGSKSGIVPLGFRPAARAVYAAFYTWTATDVGCLIGVTGAAGTLTIQGAVSGKRVLSSMAYTTADPWPSTLPGTPA